ncbi:MAG: DUF3108 domain-containing protein [Kiritimatiellales bacterium]
MKFKSVCMVFSNIFLLCAAAPAKELPFPIGEELIYTISWLGVPIAWSKAVTETNTFEGRPVLAMRITVNTFSFFDHICKVDDFYEGLIDPETFLPIRFEQNLQERNYRRHDITTFNYETLQAHYIHLPKGKTKDYKIEPESRDILSFMYFMRSVSLAENTETRYRVMSDEKTYDLFIKSFDIEPVKMEHYGLEIPCLTVKPTAAFDGLFVRKGKATVWISRDPRHLLTYAKVSTPFGRVSLTLDEVRGPGTDFWITDRKDGDDEAKK